MNIDDLKERLDTDLKIYSKILINGKWGIGKSYFIKQYFEDKKISYISLFGINSINDFKTSLYFSLGKDFKTTIIFKNITNFIKNSGISYKGFSLDFSSLPIDYIIDKLNEKNRKKDNRDEIYIIIDDLERIGNAIDIKDVLGVIENISQIDNSKIIIIANENEIKEKNKEDYTKFKEKVVEKTYNISNYSNLAFDNIYKIFLKKSKDIKNIAKRIDLGSEIKRINSVNEMNNLRTTKRQLNFCREIYLYFNKSNISDERMTELFRIGIIIVSIDSNKLYYDCITKKEEEYDEYRDDLCNIIVNNYREIYYTKAYSRNITDCIINIYKSMNIESNVSQVLDIYNVINNIISEDNKEIFYCSLEESEIILKKFMDINDKSKIKFNTWTEGLLNIYDYYNGIGKKDKLKKKDILKKIDSIVNNTEVDINNYISNYISNLNNVIIKNGFPKEFADYVEYYNKLILNKYSEILFEKIKETMKKDYDVDYIEKVFNIVITPYYRTHINATDIKKYENEIISKNFFIPDLSGSINFKIWEWTHDIYKEMSIMQESNMKEKLKKYTKTKIKEGSELEKYRYLTLLNQYLK